MMNWLQRAFIVLGFVQQNDGFFKKRPFNPVNLEGQIFRWDILIGISHCSAVDMKSASKNKSRAFMAGSKPLREKYLFSNHFKSKS